MLIPCIHFPGNCDEAIAFYKKTLGAEVKEINYFRDRPENSGMDDNLPPNFVMNSDLLIFGSPMMMTDGGEKQLTGDSFSFCICLDSTEEVTAVFNKLADGGKIVEALAPQFWASLYGMVEDRFGVGWQVMTNSCNNSK